MYKCQESAKKFYREEYPQKIKWYVEALKSVMEAESISEVEAILHISKKSDLDGMAIMLFTAAAVEIMEHSKISV